MQHIVKITSISKITHNVLKIVTEKPPGFTYNPGQATEVAINKMGWEKEKRPFTFTCLPEDNFLEFTIKSYESHHSVTNELLSLKKKDELILHDVFGAISYKGEGVFIAGGAGVTPFISIFRYLKSVNKIGNNKLLFANHTKADIILEKEFKKLLGTNFISVLSDEKRKGYAFGFITEELLREYSDSTTKYYYLCGPPALMEAVKKQLAKMEIDENSIVKEEF